MIIIILLFLTIALAFIFPLLIIYSLMKKVGIKEAWVGLVIIIVSIIFLTFVEITSIYAPTIEEQIRLYFHNDGSMAFTFFYIPIFVSILISTIMLILFTLSNKKMGN